MKDLVALLAGCVLLSPLAATAADFRFDYSRYDLTHEQAVAALYADLERDAVRYCRGEMVVYYTAGLEQCVSRILADAVIQIDSPKLAAYRREQIGERRG